MNEPKLVTIRQFWASNLEPEFQQSRLIIDMFPVISMDTEFSGVIHAPKVDPAIPYHLRHMEPSEHYNYLKKNVDDLKLIQLGLTLSDGRGNLPGTGCYSYIWEFNVRDFDPESDPHNRDSVDLLRRQGIDFKRNLEAEFQQICEIIDRFPIISMDVEFPMSFMLPRLILPYPTISGTWNI